MRYNENYDLNIITTIKQQGDALLTGRPQPPRMAIVYPTYKCNHNCPGCDYEELINKNGSSMSEEQLLWLIHELHIFGIKALEWSGGGEPTIHPGFVSASKKWIGYGHQFGLITNGKSIKNPKICEVILGGAKYIRISLVPGYERPFQVKKETINSLVKQRKNLLPEISLKLLLTRYSIANIDDALDYALDIGVDSLQFKFVRNDKLAEVDKKREIQVREYIKKLKSKHHSIDISLPVAGSVRPKMIADHPCLASSVQLLIDPIGDVYLCCYYRHRTESHCLGNVFKEGLNNIWGSEKHLKIINKVDAEDCNKYDCRFARYNNLLQSHNTSLLIQESCKSNFF